MPYCPNCGNELNESHVKLNLGHCTRCGFKIPRELLTAPSPQTPSKFGPYAPRKSHAGRNAAIAVVLVAFVGLALAGAIGSIPPKPNPGPTTYLPSCQAGYTPSGGKCCPAADPYYDPATNLCWAYPRTTVNTSNHNTGFTTQSNPSTQANPSTQSYPTSQSDYAAGVVNGQQLRTSSVNGYTEYVTPSAGWTASATGSTTYSVTISPSGQPVFTCGPTQIFNWQGVTSYVYWPNLDYMKSQAARGYSIPDLSQLSVLASIFGITYVESASGTTLLYCVSVFQVSAPPL